MPHARSRCHGMVQCASVKINILNRLYILCALTSASLAKCNEVPTSFFLLFVRSFVRSVVHWFVLFPSASSFSEDWHKIIYVKFSINKICLAALHSGHSRRGVNRYNGGARVECTAEKRKQKERNGTHDYVCIGTKHASL